jgi:uncharacterized protein
VRFNVSHLLKAPIGTRDVVHLDTGAVTLGDDLVLHFLRGDINLIRSTDSVLAEGQIDTALNSECVGCLATISLPVTVQLDDLLFALPYASRNTHQYRISENGWVYADLALREQILLSIPQSPLCRPDCRGLCSQCGQNLNNGTCDCQQQAGDPRLAVLRDLL